MNNKAKYRERPDRPVVEYNVTGYYDDKLKVRKNKPIRANCCAVEVEGKGAIASGSILNWKELPKIIK